ncbi:permease prefix domain 1-containing protein [Ruminococcaceae bacterium OttesenSCG-928-L11]|nr:permease prefix domain 1-containing protein [Ruminococcaceae bacterium OttesenSCG-928-L11]
MTRFAVRVKHRKMPVRSNIRDYVEELFSEAPKSHRTIEMKEELISNLQEKFDDLVAQGQEEHMAYDIVISSIGDISELIRSLQESYAEYHRQYRDPGEEERQRKKSAMLISVSVGIYILSLVPALLGDELGHDLLGMLFMFVMWAVATMILVYNGMTKPKDKASADDAPAALPREIRSWSASKKKIIALRNSISSILWLGATIIFVGGGMLFGGWHILWLVFLLAAVVQQIINVVARLSYPDEEEEPPYGRN